MKDTVICVHCLHELDPGLSKCPHCGNSTIRSRGVLTYLNRCDARGVPASASFITRRYEISPETANKILEMYNALNDSETKNVELNSIIKKIDVKNLFNYLNYSVDFNEDVSIILAPNGFGKTTLFNLISFVLNPNLDLFDKYIKNVPFDSFEVTLVNGNVINLSKYQLTNGKEGQTVVLQVKKNDGDVFEETMEFEEFDPVREDSDYDDDVSQSREEEIKKAKRVLANSDVWGDIFFIRTNRTFLEPKTFTYRDRRNMRVHGVEPDYFEDPIEGCNKELKKLMKAKKEEYQVLLESAKNSIAPEFLRMDAPSLSFKDFLQALEAYREQVNDLAKFGFLGDEDSKALNVINSISESDYNDKLFFKGAFLSLYVEKYAKTLTPFNDLYVKMDVFRSIINERNTGTNKHIEYSARGIEYYNGDQIIPLNCLSSGEKNDFIMFFDLIFRVKNKSIVLIDEPEISLHIIWQEKYIDNIVSALRGKDCQVIISTHSPDIISVHENMIVSLDIKKEEIND